MSTGGLRGSPLQCCVLCKSRGHGGSWEARLLGGVQSVGEKMKGRQRGLRVSWRGALQFRGTQAALLVWDGGQDCKQAMTATGGRNPEY